MTDQIKQPKSYSLSPMNIQWLRARAVALTTPVSRMSDSQFLDNLITAKREEQERAKRILRDLSPSPSPKGEGSKGKVKSKAVA